MAHDYTSPELDADTEALRRRQRIAEMIMAQSMAPIETANRSTGKFISKVSPLEPIAKALQAYVGGLQSEEAKKEAAALAEKREGLMRSELDRIAQAGQGMPAMSVQDEMDPSQAPQQVAAQPGSRDAVIRAMLTSRLPAMQQSGAQLMAKSLEPAKAPEGFTLGPGQARYTADGQLMVQGPAPTGKLGTEDVHVGGGMWQSFKVAQDGTVDLNSPIGKPFSKRPTASEVSATATSPVQETAFQKELGKGQADELLKGRAAADDAREIITTVNEGRKILDSGMITGFGAETIVKFGQALKQAGIDIGGDALANSQAYSANMAQNVGKLIKQFGAGTGLSDADREYAEKMAAGKITLDEKALIKILDINDRAARNIIRTHNKRAKGIKSNIPLLVEEPVPYERAVSSGAYEDPDKERRYQEWKRRQR